MLGVQNYNNSRYTNYAFTLCEYKGTKQQEPYKSLCLQKVREVGLRGCNILFTQQIKNCTAKKRKMT